MADTTTSNPHQIYQIVNSMAEQSLGMKDLQPTDASFVSVGKTVLSSEDNKDAFFKTLVSRIGRTVLALREYEIEVAEMSREPFVYGSILQKISFRLPKARNNDTWDSVPSDNTDPFQEYDTEFMQVFFDKWETWEVAGTCPDVQLETAFTNATTMMAFIDGILFEMNESMKISYENLGNLTRAALIGDVVTSSVANISVNILAEYNAVMDDTLTYDDALYSPEFLRYSAQRIKKTVKRLSKKSTTFNKAAWERHTPKEYLIFEALTDYVSALDTYLQSDVFHNELTKLSGYKEIAYWQGSGTTWDFDDVSAIDVTFETTNLAGSIVTKTAKQKGIIAVLRDIDSCGITIDKRRTKSIYNPRREVTNYWLKAEMGHFRDMSENCVVFYIE